MLVETSKLKSYQFNEKYFDILKGTDYEALKKDIEKNGIKTELHILKDNTVVCGNQRLKIAKELELKEVPIKVIELKNDEEIREYVIKDNLLRRHLKPEQKAILEYELYKIKFKGSGGDRKSENQKDDFRPFDVYKEIADEVGSGETTIKEHIRYAKIIEKKPELQNKKISQVLKEEVKDYSIEIDLDKINQYDDNMFHFSATYHEKRFGDVLCVDTTHGEDDIRQYKEYYPTVTRLSCFFDKNGKEFSLRKYAEIQDFPKDFKFVGTTQEIKNQIGEAVSPKMGEYVIKKHIKGKKYIELFAGCGGFSVGAHRLNKECLWCNDFNKYSGYSYQLNFPKTDVCINNIKKVNEKQIHKDIEEIDFILGGPPCQGFSSAGKRLGFKEDSRNQLYLDYLRFVKEFKPKQFIMENVKEILKHQDEIRKDFENIGYDITIDVVNGLDIGMKQKRIRCFFIGNKK